METHIVSELLADRPRSSVVDRSLELQFVVLFGVFNMAPGGVFGHPFFLFWGGVSCYRRACPAEYVSCCLQSQVRVEFA